MALFETLGEMVGVAALTAAPACDLIVRDGVLSEAAAFHGWLRQRNEDKQITALIDALARDIWGGADTRALSQQILEQHARTVCDILAEYPPTVAMLRLAVSRPQTGPNGAGRTPDGASRRIAVDVCARARAAGRLGKAGMKDEVILFLVHRSYAHLLEDPKVLYALAPALSDFIAERQPADSEPTPEEQPAAEHPASGHDLSGPIVARIAAAGGGAFLNDLQERFGLSQKAVHRILSLLDAQGVRPDDVVVRLQELANWVAEVRGQLLKPANEDAEVRRLKMEAAACLAEGDFDAAMAALRNVRRELRDSRRRTEERLQEEVTSLTMQMAEEARATGRLAEIALARQDYAVAAELFSEAVLCLPTADRDRAWKFQAQRAEALYLLGADTADIEALNEALGAFSQVLRVVAENSDPHGLAQASMGVANTLHLIGKRENGTARLRDASTAYRKAISTIRREDDARSWSTAQLGLARTLSLIGERDDLPAALNESAAAYRDALREFGSDQFPMDHVAAQLGLGGVLLAIEEREGGAPLLSEAAQAFQGAIKMIGRSDPTQWAEAQLNLGLALLGLGEQQGDTARLSGAVDAFHAALDIYGRSTSPQKWAVVHMNLGNALAALGDRNSKGTEQLEQAIAAYTAALEEFRRESQPLKWAITQMNLGTALIRLGERRDKRRNWLAAAGALVPALEVFEEQGAVAHADVTRQNLRRFNEGWDALIAAPPGMPQKVTSNELHNTRLSRVG
jgi:tetratricopeptide (TPR) repeat protein